MSVESLKCKECGATYELGASYACENCFGPLEVAYDHSGLDPAEAKRRIQAGSQGIWRYADFLPASGPAPNALPVGLTPLIPAPRPPRLRSPVVDAPARRRSRCTPR